VSEVFVSSGESSDITAGPPPLLQGLFLPAIDNPEFIDGFGIVTPWGGGSTTRRYGDYGISTEISRQSTQLNDLASSLIPAGGGGVSFGLEGPQGIQGVPGRDGIDGIIHVMGLNLPQNSNFLAELPHNIDLINDLGTAVNRLIYTSAYTAYRNFVWAKTSIASSIKTWNKSDINEDASFFIIAADAGIYVSINDGDSWGVDNPDADSYIQASCAASGGKAVVLGNTNRADGTIWTTTDYGVNWTEKTVSVTAAATLRDTCDSQTLVYNFPHATTEQVGQTITPTEVYTLETIKFYAKYVYGDPGTCYVSLQETTGGLPNGSLLTDRLSFTVTSSKALKSITFGTQPVLEIGTKYVIVFEAPSGVPNTSELKLYGWPSDGNQYIGGERVWYNGSVWAAVPTQDVNFYCWGSSDVSADVQSVRLSSAGNFVVATGENGVFLSTDFGDNWAKKTPDGVGTTDWKKGICSSDGTYIIVVSSANAIYRSADSGTAWAAITPAGGDTFSVNDLATSDDGQFMVIVGANSTDATESCYISTDYGATWTAKKPVDVSIEWTECDISNDGAIIAVSTSSYFYISFDSGTTWKEQGMASSAEVWEGLSISGDGTTGLIANTNDNDEFFIGTNTLLYSEATWAESVLTSAGRAILDDATAGAQATTLGLGTGDSPTWVGATFSGLTATYVPFIDTGGVLAEDSVFTWDKDNNYLKVGFLKLGGEHRIIIDDPDANAGLTLNAKGTGGVYFNYIDGGSGGMYFYNGANQKLMWFGGTTYGEFRGYDQDYAEWIQFACASGYGYLEVKGTSPNPLIFNNSAESDIWMFQAATSGETPGFRVYGYKSGDAKRFLDVTVGGSANDTVDFTGLSNYKFGGNLVILDTGYIGSASDPNAIRIAANGEVTFTDVATGILPTAGGHFATKEYVDLAGLSGRDYWMSNTDDGVIADYHMMYPAETGDAESTEPSDGMTAGDNQLMFSFITEAGEPGLTQIRSGVYRLHTHLHKGSGDPDTVFYWTLSKRLADDPYTETLLMKSETSGEIPDTTPESFETHAALTTGVSLGVTDRLVLKYYANVTGGGTSEVTVTMEGTHDCHLSIQAPSSIWQNQGDMLDAINALGDIADNEFLVGTGAGTLAWEATTTVRTSLGLGTGDSPQFTGIELGHATDTTITRASAGNLNIQGNLVYRAGGTDVPIGDGGTGQSTAQLAINALSAVSGGTNEHVLTKDTASGNAIWKVAAGGGVSTWIDLTDTDPANYTGQAGNTVVVNAGEDGLEFGAAPGGAFTSKCSIYRNATQTITTETWTKIQLNIEDYDTDGEFDNVTNYRFEPNVTGYYHIDIGIGLSNLADGKYMAVGIYKNEAVWKFSKQPSHLATYDPQPSISCDMYLLDTDNIELWVWHNHGSNRNTVDSRAATFMDIHRFA